MRSVAIIQPLSLIGKELREQLDARPEIALEQRLYTSIEDEVGTVTEVSGAAAFVNRWSEAVADDCDLAVFCGDLASDRAALALLPAGVRSLMLSTGATIPDGVPAVANCQENLWIAEAKLIAPSPVTLLLARLIEALAGAGAIELSATALMPVSERDQAGLDHLFEETRTTLSLAGRKKRQLFAAQVAFNLFPAPVGGDEIERQITAIFSSASLPLPAVSVQTIQAGLFHGIGASVRLRLAGELSVAELRKHLAGSPALELVKHPAELGTVDAAGAPRILIGDVRRGADGSHWLWATMDNFTIGRASNAAEVLATIASHASSA